LAQYNFKTTDKSITEYLDKQKNVSQTIKDAIRIKQAYELNPKPEEKKSVSEFKNVVLEI